MSDDPVALWSRAFFATPAPDDECMVTDTDGRIRYITVRQLMRGVQHVKRLPRARAGETGPQWIAGMVDTGQLPLNALIRYATTEPGSELCDVHFVTLDNEV